MSISRVLLSMLCLLVAQSASAETYPSRPITLIVPFSANGPTDLIARTIGTAMSKNLKQAIIVENVGGAGGTVASAQVAQAEPDGYTMLLHHVGMATAPTVYPNLSFDPLKDFEYIGEVTDVPMVLLARPDFPYKDLKSFVAYAKANRGKVTLGHAGTASASHLCSLLLMSALGIELKVVTYKGTGPAMDDVLASKIDVLCDQTTSATAQIRAGKVRTLGIATAKRLPTLPDVPTFAEAGVKNLNIAVFHVIYVPKETPAPVVKRLNEALKAALQDSSVKARLADLGTEIVPMSKVSPEYVRQHLGAEIRRWEPVVKKSAVE
jgi:tripartite-type tricarboxylate transporter receptor subunit TctC